LVDFFAPELDFADEEVEDFDFAAPDELLALDFAGVELFAVDFDFAAGAFFVESDSLAEDFALVEASSFAAAFDFAGAELFAVVV
jgi:hypothetical protein